MSRLCRYITRAPLAQDRLELRPDGKLELTLKNVWKDGTRALLLEPRDLIIRLIAAIPPPRFHLVRYLASFQATPGSVPKSSLSRHRILSLSSRLQLRATSLSSTRPTPN